MENSPQPVPSGPTPVLNLSGGDILIVPVDDPELSKYYYLAIAGCISFDAEGQGRGSQGGPEGYRTWGWKGWEEGVLKEPKKRGIYAKMLNIPQPKKG